MAKISWKPGNMVYPLPAVLVTCSNGRGEDNVLTIAWTGTVCTNPPMTYISVRPERHSYHIIKESGEFIINLTTKELAKATDFCGVRSGKDMDKFEQMHLTKEKAKVVNVPMIAESPVNIECKVIEIKELGSHHMFLAEVVNVNVDESLMDETGKFHLSRSNPLVYSHGEYYETGKELGSFGYSVKKKKAKKKKRKERYRE
ncbi:MAG: flavin reductase family protein [Lachnospiraceae bacterium]|nr:flavin reductase family protein [Lachnospiraceae bacterium]